ncbi:hypothetical protein HNR20_002597 [Micromonospora parathelypteridis]|uniref:Response regulatory domain-containing protein n=1 Tax=Micromonospora parathelypteridis TaxID=1839617 RepID=A0A840VMA3_9ACTN|nr:hypothetical protein [Micromonospora parathelypteridis]
MRVLIAEDNILLQEGLNLLLSTRRIRGDGGGGLARRHHRGD